MNGHSLEGQVRAIREWAAVSSLPHLRVVRVSGDSAWDYLDRLLPCEVYLREGQLRPTLLLRSDDTIFADVLVGADELDFWLVVDGPTEEDLLAYLDAARLPGESVSFASQARSHAVLTVDGPYAWKVLEGVAERGIGGMPYLSLAHLDDGMLCGRAGKTGEYGYFLHVPLDRVEATRAKLGDLVQAGEAALAHCALESWFFDIHAAGVADLTPLELQLQWRLSRRKAHVCGMAALGTRRAAGGLRRTVGLRGPLGMAAGDPLVIAGETVGTVLQSAPWLGASGGSIGMGLLPGPIAHPGLDVLAVPAGPVRTVSPPFLVNRSLLVKPSRRPPDPASLPDPYA